MLIRHSLICPVLTAFLLFFPATALWAGDEETHQLDEITVTAPVIQGNETDSYAGQKTLVSEDQIDDLNAQDLTSALRKTPGVTISRYNPVGSFGGGEGGAIFIRGMGSSRPGSEIKAYINDIPMYMSIWNHPLMDLLSVDAARAIEVYKSPQPQHFGNAVAAVNIVPKSREAAGTESRVKIAGGSFNTYVSTAESGGRFERSNYYIGGGYRSSDGHRDYSDGKTGNLYCRIGYDLTPAWQLDFFGLYSDNEASDPGSTDAPITQRQGTYETQAQMGSLTLANTHDRAKRYIKVYANTGKGDWLGQPTSTPGVSEDLYNNFEFYGMKAKETIRPWEGGKFLAGLDWEHTGGDYEAYFRNGNTDHWTGAHFTMTSPYTALSHTFEAGERVSITPSAGVRYYDNSVFGSEWSPHAGVVLAVDTWQFHAKYSRGVVYPGLDVIVFSQEVIPGLGDSWKNLKPEVMDHFEVGISSFWGDWVRADVTGFYNDGKNRYVFVPAAGGPPSYANVEEYRTKGVEFALNFFPTQNLSLFLGATFLRAEPADLPYAPEKSYSAGLNWRFLRAFTLNLDAQYVDEMAVSSQARRAGAVNTQLVDDYALFNAKLSWEFWLTGDTVSGTLFIAGENLTDEDYEHRPGYPMPGINGMAGITLTF